MNIFLTGGSGFIGLNILEAFSDEPENTIVIYSLNTPPKAAVHMLNQRRAKIIWMKGDVLDRNHIEQAMKQYKTNYVIHASAITPDYFCELNNMRQVVEVNCIGTLNILEAARNNQVKRVLYISSVAVYGDTPQRYESITVDSFKNPTTTYEITKFATESLCKRFSFLHNMDIAALRLGDVYGAWEYKTGVRGTMSAPFYAVYCALSGIKAKMKKPGKTGWIYGKDVGRAVKALLTAKTLRQFAYNCGGNEPWSVSDLCEKLKEYYPNFEWEIVTDQTPTVIFFSEKDNGLFDIMPLTRDTGFIPQYGLQKALADYIEWIHTYPEMILGENPSCFTN